MINFNIKNRLGFTMMELVFVIVVLGTLATLVMPRLDRDIRQEAADNILSAIRYTQHLALNDDKHAFNDPNWHRKLWTIRFSNADYTYTVFSDTSQAGGINTNEIARDPANGKRMDGTDANIGANDSPNVFLGDKYDINAIRLTANTCTTPNNSVSLSISFDILGRPHRGSVGTANTNDLRTYVQADCSFEFVSPAFTGNPIIIDIQRETGYATIRNQIDS